MSALHVCDAFRRYELKYLADGAAVPALLAEFGRRLDHDEYADGGGYDVWSVYYDSPQLRFYWDKVDGRPFRQKLRVRRYGDAALEADTTVYVEIKQQVDRVTEKRRVPLPYRLARRLCDGREPVARRDGEAPFLSEVLRLVSRLDLHPVSVIAYRRGAFVGRGTEHDLRVTLDRAIRGRAWDLELCGDAADVPILAPSRAMLEVKAAGRVPYWLTALITRYRLPMVRFSKYCQSVEAFGRAPHSAFHIPDPVHACVVAR